MGRFFGLLTATATVMLLASGNAIGADPKATVTAASGYISGTPPKCKPYGTFSLDKKSVTGDEYQVLVDYGTLSMGAFTKWTGPAEYTAGVTTVLNATEYTWGPTEEKDVTGAPGGFVVRARVQWRPAANVAWKEIGVTYTPGASSGKG